MHIFSQVSKAQFKMVSDTAARKRGIDYPVALGICLRKNRRSRGGKSGHGLKEPVYNISSQKYIRQCAKKSSSKPSKGHQCKGLFQARVLTGRESTDDYSQGKGEKSGQSKGNHAIGLAIVGCNCTWHQKQNRKKL
ncbi:Uncharacterised protein [uncultured archaeon]|nr:Uncharacterised protein [uncultured archaeon]